MRTCRCAKYFAHFAKECEFFTALPGPRGVWGDEGDGATAGTTGRTGTTATKEVCWVEVACVITNILTPLSPYSHICRVGWRSLGRPSLITLC